MEVGREYGQLHKTLRWGSVSETVSDGVGVLRPTAKCSVCSSQGDEMLEIKQPASSDLELPTPGSGCRAPVAIRQRLRRSCPPWGTVSA